MIGDFHTHMNGNGPANRYHNIRYLCETSLELGFDSIYLGCHDFVCPKNLAIRAEREFNITVLRGAEITTDGGHLLALNIDYIPKDCWANDKNPLDVYKAIDMIRGQGGKAVMAHPYPTNKHFSWPNKFKEVVHLLDGAEVANLKSLIRDNITFDHVKQYEHLVQFKCSDCHPWEGDALDGKYFTELDIGWFGELK